MAIDLTKLSPEVVEALKVLGEQLPGFIPDKRDAAAVVVVKELEKLYADYTPPEQVNVQRFITARLDDSFEGFANYLIIAAVVALEKKRGGKNLVAKAFGGPGEAGRDLRESATVVFTVNGVALPFVQAMRGLYEQWDRIVSEAAVALVQRKFEDRLEGLHSKLDTLMDEMDRVLGIEREDR